MIYFLYKYINMPYRPSYDKLPRSKLTKKDLRDLIDQLNEIMVAKDQEMNKRELEYQFLSDEYDEMLKHKNRIIANLKTGKLM